MNILVVDGGGTRTRGWMVETTSGRTFLSAETGPSNLSRVGDEGLSSALVELLVELGDKPSIDAAVLGLAGVGRNPELRRAEIVSRKALPCKDIHVMTDAELAYLGAFSRGKRGILLIAGTGCIACFQASLHGEFLRAGGWGPLLGDEGGGAWLGKEVLRHCLYEWEDDELSPLHNAVMEAMGIEEAPQILTKVYHEDFGPTEWATLVPLVFQFAREDKWARFLLNRTARRLVALADRLVQHLPQNSQDVPLAISGGLWEHRELLQPPMDEEILQRGLPLVISDPAGGVVEGALLLLREGGR